MTNIVESAMLRESVGAVMKETRSFRPFKSSEEYLYAMKEDLAEWLNMLYPELDINVDNFMDRLDTGVALCKHANSVRQRAREYLERRQARRMTASTTGTTSMALTIAEMGDVHFLPAAKPGTFFARDNVSNFISWCKRGLSILECLLFETDDLILRKNEKHVILCLLEVARRGSRFGMLAPMLVQLEREIDREIAAEQRALQRANSVEADDEEEDEDDDEGDGFLRQYGPMPQIVTNDLKSLDEMVRDLVERCTCPVQFPMIRVSEGKYRIGDTKVLIFVRILRNHVMVRVGGGWDTLSHYLDKHDPCRCKTAHRSPLSTKLILKSNGPLELNNAQVLYERSPPRTRRSSASSVSSGGGGGGVTNTLPVTGVSNRSRSPTPRRSLGAAPAPGTYLHPRPASHHGGSSSAIDILCGSGRRSTTPTSGRNRSRSPTPRLNVPGSPSRRASNTGLDRRSRSPTPTKNRPPSRNSTISAVDNNNVQQQMNINNNNDTMTEKEIPPTVVVAAEHDSGSEVSDEGYRSLGLVNPSSTADPATATKAAEAEESKQEETGLLQTEPEDTRQIECPVITTQRPPSECGSCESGSAKHRKTPDTGRMTRSRSTDHTATPLDSLPGSPRRSAVQYRSMRSDPRTSASSSQPGSPRRQPVSNTNTWSGRQGKAKQRPSLTGTTFMGPGSGFDVSNRNSFQRRSLGAYGGAGSSAQSSPSRTAPGGTPRRHKGSLPASLQGSPTKQISPLLEQILQVKELDDDITVLNKMREIIQHYSDIVDEKLGEETRHEQEAASGETLPVEDGVDFTSAWVHGNGTLDGIRSRKSSCASDYVPKAAPSPRKDSKVEGSVSRIPAPIFYRPTAATTVELTTRDS